MQSPSSCDDDVLDDEDVTTFGPDFANSGGDDEEVTAQVMDISFPPAAPPNPDNISTQKLSCSLGRGRRSSIECGSHVVTLEGCGYKNGAIVALVTLSVRDVKSGAKVEVNQEITGAQMGDPEAVPWQTHLGLQLRVLSSNGENEAVVQCSPA